MSDKIYNERNLGVIKDLYEKIKVLRNLLAALDKNTAIDCNEGILTIHFNSDEDAEAAFDALNGE